MLRAKSVGTVVMSLCMSLGLCVACGGSSNDGKGDGAGFSTSVPGDKKLNELSDAETDQLCKDVESFTTTVAASSKEFSCRFAGLLAGSTAKTDADLRSACKTSYDKCLAAPADSETSTCEKPDASCAATVAELQTCAQDSVKMIESLKNAIPTCSQATIESLRNLDVPESETPGSCQAVEVKCPDSPMDNGGL